MRVHTQTKLVANNGILLQQQQLRTSWCGHSPISPIASFPHPTICFYHTHHHIKSLIACQLPTLIKYNIQ